MLKFLAGSALMVLGLTVVPSTGQADTLSPIFGRAAVVPTTTAQNKSILGKGYYADLYGSYGVDYANYAVYYANYGYYSDAATYAYDAYQNFSIAAYYQYYGQ